MESKATGADILVRGRDDRTVVVARAVGRGTVVLIGDTRFGFNKNLEYIGGQPFANGFENAHFWRWLISRVTGQTEWVPPPPQEPAANQDLEPSDGSEEAS